MDSAIAEALRQDGFALLHAVCDPGALEEVDRFTREAIARWSRGEDDDPDFWHWTDGDGGRRLYRIHNLETKHPCVERLVAGGPLRELVERVQGPGCHPTAFALVIKEPLHGSAIPWHRDRDGLPPGRVFNWSLYLDDSTAENGCLEAVPGSHHDAELRTEPEVRPAGAVHIPARRADMIVHDVRLLHGSAFSQSPSLRRSIIVEWRPAGLA